MPTLGLAGLGLGHLGLVVLAGLACVGLENGLGWIGLGMDVLGWIDSLGWVRMKFARLGTAVTDLPGLG